MLCAAVTCKTCGVDGLSGLERCCVVHSCDLKSLCCGRGVWSGNGVLISLVHQVVKLVEIDIPETLIEEQSKQKFANMMSDFKAKVCPHLRHRNVQRFRGGLVGAEPAEVRQHDV